MTPIAPSHNLSDEPFRVHFLLPSLAGGGAERVFLTLLRHLDRRRFSPELVLHDGQPADYAAGIPEDVPVTCLNRHRAREAPLALLMHIRRTRPAAVFTTMGHMNLLLGALRPFVPRATKLVGRETNMMSAAIAAGADGKVPGWLPPTYRLLLPGLDHIVCQCEPMREDLVKTFGYPEQKTTVIANPVDQLAVLAQARDEQTPFPTETGLLRLVAAGRLERVKGFDLLIAAIGQCADLPVVLDILGGGGEQEALQSQIRASGLDNRVFLRGFCANPYPWLAHADALVLSSRFEAFPNAVLEALALGTPVVAVPCPGGIGEILDGLPGCVLADAVSAEALAAALRRWATQGPVRVPPADIAHFGVDRIVRQYETVILNVIAPGTPT